MSDEIMLGEVFERAIEAYIVLDKHLKIVSINRTACNLLQAKTDTQQPELADQLKLREALTNASGVSDWIPLRLTLTGPERSHTFYARLRRLRDEPDTHLYIVSLDGSRAERNAFRMLREEVVRANARSATLKVAKKRMANVIEATQAGCWEWDLRSGNVWANEYWRWMFGLNEDEIGNSIQNWRRICHPDDMDRTEKHLDAFIKDTAEDTDFEVRFRHKEGHWIWIAETSRVVERDKNGTPVTVAGIHVDITQRKAHERELEEKRLEAEAANIAKSQ
ncbi:MAG: PAS domain-containing protein [Alphaproteobacteria bacterium]|nr:PAS domain-containing protein [Alphaproteobacteria bacterium]